MEIEKLTAEQQLLQHAERQTKALESMNGVLLFLLALAILGAVTGLGLALNS